MRRRGLTPAAQSDFVSKNSEIITQSLRPLPTAIISPRTVGSFNLLRLALVGFRAGVGRSTERSSGAAGSSAAAAAPEVRRKAPGEED